MDTGLLLVIRDHKNQNHKDHSDLLYFFCELRSVIPMVGICVLFPRKLQMRKSRRKVDICSATLYVCEKFFKGSASSLENLMGYTFLKVENG